MKKRLFSCIALMMMLIFIVFVGCLYAGAETDGHTLIGKYGQPYMECVKVIGIIKDIGKVKLTAEPEKVISLSLADKRRLARLAMAEAEDEGVVGKALVICVVWNRVQDKGFPNTVKEVIYEKNQFAVIGNGRYDKVKPDKECYEAVRMFENGWNKSRGALYFESKSDSTWHEDNLQFLFKHNNHYFYVEE